MLVLFDIDGTLLKAAGAGLKAMKSALEELHPGASVNFEGIEVNGRLDTLIWRDCAARHALPGDAEAHGRFRHAYGEHLKARLGANNTVTAIPGARELVEALRMVAGVELGLLTGNYEHTGLLKVDLAGIDTAAFRVNAWADDGPDRRSLPPVAMARYQRMHGRPVAPASVIIIGDTEHDIDCARAHGCRVLATATGTVRHAELEAAGACLAVENLTDTEGLVRWILACRPAALA